MERNHRTGSEAGAALYMSLVTLVALLSISTAMVVTSTKTREEYAGVQDEMRRRCMAESGLARAILDLEAGGTGNLGSGTAPVSFGGGAFWVECRKESDALFVATSHGIAANGERALRAVVEKKRGVFHHAMFIGNSSGDPAYTFKLGGWGRPRTS